MDYDKLAAELIRALRGKRSQTALSRRLGYKTNILYIWEAQRGSPTAAGFMQLAERVGINVTGSIETFYRGRPPWLSDHCPTSPAGIAALLTDLLGSTTVSETVTGLRRSRFALARWLKGTAEPRLPDFLQAVEVTSLRLLDFVASLTDPAGIACMKSQWVELQSARQAAYHRPWSHAILRALELAQYQALAQHEPGWLANYLGLELAEEESCLALLASAGQIQSVDGKWQIGRTQTIDTRRDPDAAKQLKAWWSKVGTERLEAGANGVFSYNVFGVSDADLERLQALQRAYFRELRSIVAQSQPVQNVVVANLQLFTLGRHSE